jgi:pimeloyl-ACP methyl ester carboxylesterase
VVTNDGVRLYYEERGQGKPLVLIRGWTFGDRFPRRNVDALAEQFRVINLDLRGHGDSEKPPTVTDSLCWSRTCPTCSRRSTSEK